MTDVFQVDAAAMIAAHEANGFHLIDCAPGTPGIRVGARVHNRGEQYLKAAVDGTATVLAVMRRGSDEQPDSWERTYGRPNVEVIVLRDRDHSVTAWADYGTRLAEKQPATPEVAR